MTLENNRKAAYDFLDQIWSKKDESAIDCLIALDAALEKGMDLHLL